MTDYLEAGNTESARVSQYDIELTHKGVSYRGRQILPRYPIWECADFLLGVSRHLLGVSGAKAEIKLAMKCVLTEELRE